MVKVRGRNSNGKTVEQQKKKAGASDLKWSWSAGISSYATCRSYTRHGSAWFIVREWWSWVVERESVRERERERETLVTWLISPRWHWNRQWSCIWLPQPHQQNWASFLFLCSKLAFQITRCRKTSFIPRQQFCKLCIPRSYRVLLIYLYSCISEWTRETVLNTYPEVK